MVYIRADGNVNERRSPWRFSIIKDVFNGVIGFFSLFIRAITAHPDQRDQLRTTYAQRNQFGGSRLGSSSGNGGGQRRSNIRGVKNLTGEACGVAGGG